MSAQPPKAALPKGAFVWMTEADARALFHLAGFTVTCAWELANMYWGGTLHIALNELGIPPSGPWWLLMTEIGPVRIGWRKRVLEIDWCATSVRAVVTEDATTKSDTYVHAWNAEAALRYLKSLRRCAPQPTPKEDRDHECG